MGRGRTAYVLIEDKNTFQAIAIGGWLNSGAFYDYEGKCGLHHFMEHIIFNIPKIRQLSDALKEKGAVINAFTSHEIICFYAVCLEEDYEKAYELIETIIVSRLDFSKAENFENEKKIILNEIEYHSSYTEYLKELLLQQMFGKTAEQFSILGNEKSVSGVTALDVTALYNDKFSNCNKLITIIGNSTKIKAPVEKEERSNTLLPVYGSIMPDKKREPLIQEVKDKDEICYYGISLFYPKQYRKEGLTFTEYVKGELLEEIRETNGAAYRIDGSNMNFGQGAVSFLIIKIMKKDVELVKNCIHTVLRTFKDGLIEKLYEIQKKVTTRSQIKNDNVLSRMLNLGYEQTILFREGETCEMETFLNYLKTTLEKGEDYYCQRIIGRIK